MDCVVTHVVHPDEFHAHVVSEKSIQDFEKLEKLIQGYCLKRVKLFHEIGNVELGEILFVKSSLKNGLYVRARVLKIDADTCDVELVDYGAVEKGVSEVLKVDPSVKKFIEIPTLAKVYSLAFVTAVGGVWSPDAIDLFKKLCEGKLKALSTDDPRLISLIIRNGNTFTDLSEVLIQAGHAKRICIEEHDDALSEVISSASGLSQYQSVAVQTESVTNLLKPPPGFQNIEDNKNNSKGSAESSIAGSTQDRNTSVYIPPAMRAGQRNTGFKTVDQIFKLSHDENCTCLICFIRMTMSRQHLTNKEKLQSILSQDWPDLTSKQDAMLRCSITGNQLSSEDRELLMDIMIGLLKKSHSRRRSIDSSTQITSSMNRMTLSSYDVDSEVNLRQKDNITIIKSEPDYNESYNTQRNTDAKLQGVGSSTVHSDSAYNTSAHMYDDNNEWSDPADGFLSDSDSEDDIIIEKTNTHIRPPNPSMSSSLSAPNSALATPNKDFVSIPTGPSSSLGTTPKSSPIRPIGRGYSFGERHSPKKQNPTAVGNQSKSKYVFRPMPSAQISSQQPSSGTSGFGMIMYCTFCGATTHKSSMCPDGTKNLFL